MGSVPDNKEGTDGGHGTSTAAQDHEEVVCTRENPCRACRELPPDHPVRRQVEEGSAAAHAAMPSVKLPLPQHAEQAAAQDRSCSKCGYKGNARPCPDPDCPSRPVEAKPGFAVCESCDPPRQVPSGEVVAHLTEHHLSISEIAHAEVAYADE